MMPIAEPIYPKTKIDFNFFFFIRKSILFIQMGQILFPLGRKRRDRNGWDQDTVLRKPSLSRIDDKDARLSFYSFDE